MNDNNRNLMLAIALSAAVLFGWQYFVAMPAMKADQAKQALMWDPLESTCRHASLSIL